ncbi:hypothetical protein [Actinomadura parmotrematis]|uniref:DUF1963 domain-containing protein n=1 Tax=Actinomadura parmotrematis TaxID=2864039 RepID=A0ABS7FPN7_9ACTN|nr:hypothetical protein [Actinomadura parmotrematis]MBW8482316.1 hypothetical protein [Actinomadura parmotrematis]
MTSDPAAWNRELAAAFGALLGRPLDAYPQAEYALYAWADEVSYMALEDLLDGEPDAPAGPVPVLDVPPGFDWDLLPADDDRSLWLIEDGAFDGAAGAALTAVALGDGGTRAVTGADFARVLAPYAEELDADELIGQVRWLQRVRTDGTLLDAMRAATWTLHGPDGLVAFAPGAEVEPAHEKALAAVPDARLRDHLRMLCLTAHWARSDGAYFLGPGEHAYDFEWIAGRPGRTAVAGWEFGEGQGATTIFAIA